MPVRRGIFAGEPKEGVEELTLFLLRAANSSGRIHDERTNLIHARTDRDILSTLLHEMVHHWQYRFGTPGRRGYHNIEFAAKMLEVGLHASDTGMLSLLLIPGLPTITSRLNFPSANARM